MISQTDFFMTCKTVMADVAIQQGEQAGEAVAELSRNVSLRFQRHPKALGMALVLHNGDEQYLVGNTNQLRTIALVRFECKHNNSDLYMRLHEYATGNLIAC